MDLLCILLLSILTAYGKGDANEPKSVVIETPSGPVRGYHELVKNYLSVYRFIRIPYAKPPVGDLRFRKPQPVERWTEVQGIPDLHGPACMQQDIGLGIDYTPEYSEDCLQLNVYVPGEVSPKQSLSVMVWVHGGGFVVGFAGETNGQRLAAEGDVIVVTINYRLGLFGFLNLHDPVSKGNYGLWDQMMAFRWVHENIAAFGGNPYSVTIFGESAGGMSVHFQTLIPANTGMFQRAISMSGVVNRQVITADSDIDKMNERISEKTSCPIQNKAEFFACLQKIPASEVLHAVNIYDFMASDNFTVEMLMGPSMDDELITSKLYFTMHDDSSPEGQFFRSLDFMTGTTSAEGSLLYFTLMPELQETYNFSVEKGIPRHVLCNVIIPGLVQELFGNKPELSKKLCEFYTTDKGDDDQSNRATDFYGDSVMVAPATSALIAHARNNANHKTYHYILSATSPLPFGPPPPPWFRGAGHADDLYHLFDMPVLPVYNHTEERHNRLSEKIIRYFSNFAKTGDPNSEETPVRWPTYDIKKREYLDFDFEISVKKDFNVGATRIMHPELKELWDDIKEEL
ncbi:liver carboxylesterase 1-like [Saccostrea echinata]|uniref:liver carboxylesterase 1-like n=1 Tax=Saccostrea echinata TaxID=191078 RepID=UPI002A7F8C01|nr:liver carboxylesterase 1-like [Saccostrea echinata]